MARYADAVEWIAFNDAAGDEASEEEVAGFVSTLLVADVFNKQPQKVAKDILRFRKKHGILPDSF